MATLPIRERVRERERERERESEGETERVFPSQRIRDISAWLIYWCCLFMLCCTWLAGKTSRLFLHMFPCKGQGLCRMENMLRCLMGDSLAFNPLNPRPILKMSSKPFSETLMLLHMFACSCSGLGLRLERYSWLITTPRKRELWTFSGFSGSGAFWIQYFPDYKAHFKA